MGLSPPHQARSRTTASDEVRALTAINSGTSLTGGTPELRRWPSGSGARYDPATGCEYRTRLIAEVVTGKLDVRGVELPELEETEDLMPLEENEDRDSEDEPFAEAETDA